MNEPASERRRSFTILFLSMICLGAGGTVMFAVLPSFARKLGLSEFQGSLPFVTSATIWWFSSGYWGRKSDVWGRKPVILLGLTAFGVSFASFAMIANLGVNGFLSVAVAYPMMIAARALYGIFGSGAQPAAQAYVADRTSLSERTSGTATISAGSGLGMVLGPAIGSVFAVFGIFAPFYFTALLAFASAASVWWLLPEHSRPHVAAADRHTVKWHDHRIWPFVIFGIGFNTASSVPQQTIGYLFIDVLHFLPSKAPQYTGIGFMAGALAALFAQLVVVQRFNMSARTLMRTGGLVCIVAFALFAVGRSFGPLVFAQIISGLGFGMLRPGYAAAASLAVKPHEQGAVAGLTGATSGAGFIFGPMIATALYHMHPSAPYIFGATLMLVCYLYSVFSPHLKNAGLVPDEEQIEESSEIANV